MRYRGHLTAKVLAVVTLLVGCGESGQTTPSESLASDDSGVPQTSDEAATSTATSTAPPTSAVTTTTIDSTIFNPQRIGDLAELSSFVFTIDEFHSFNGQVTTRKTNVGYIKDPFSAYVVTELGGPDVVDEYLVDGRYYQRDHQNYWTLYEAGSLGTPNILYPIETEYALSSVSTAQFIGEETFAGVPAFHFSFDETNLFNFGSYTPERPSPEVEGDFYLAQDGNHPLYVHSLSVSTGEGFELIDEYTETVSQLNQLTEITLPADIQPLEDAFDLGLTFGIPMPADSRLDSMINYNDGGIGVYYYQYTSSWKNEDEFLAFYQSMVPTNGWEVSHIGQVHNLDVHCADGNCVIIENADKQFILYFDGSNLHADYDREHRFSPQ